MATTRKNVFDALNTAIELMLMEGITIKKGSTKIPISVYNAGDDIDFTKIDMPCMALGPPEGDKRKVEREKRIKKMGEDARVYPPNLAITVSYQVEVFAQDPRTDCILLEAMLRKTGTITSIEVEFKSGKFDSLNLFWEKPVLDQATLPDFFHRIYPIKVWASVEIFEFKEKPLVLSVEAEEV